MRILLINMIIRMLSKSATRIMTRMERCEKTLDPYDNEDMEHLEEHARRRQAMGQVLGRLHDLRTSLTSRS